MQVSLQSHIKTLALRFLAVCIWDPPGVGTVISPTFVWTGKMRDRDTSGEGGGGEGEVQSACFCVGRLLTS
jgi:hypothetical protein